MANELFLACSNSTNITCATVHGPDWSIVHPRAVYVVRPSRRESGFELPSSGLVEERPFMAALKAIEIRASALVQGKSDFTKCKTAFSSIGTHNHRRHGPMWKNEENNSLRRSPARSAAERDKLCWIERNR
jgi:hypothetical protein